MIQTNAIDPTAIDWESFDEAMRLATRRAIWERKQLGYPVYAMKDGKMQWIAPEDINVEKPDDFPTAVPPS